jgi:protein TonB
VHRFDQRQGFLVSAVLHLVLLMVLISTPPSVGKRPDEIDPASLERKQVVFVPPAALLRQLAPPPPAGARPVPAPVPTPPPQDARKKDRISVGPPSEVRQKGPMILRREDDLTQAPKGQPNLPRPPMPTPPPAVAQQRPQQQQQQQQGGPAVADASGREGLRLPPGFGRDMTRGDDGSRAKPGSIGSSLQGAVEGVARRLDRDAQMGVPTGRGQNLGGLYFDPQGADFTLWISRFKDEVYRNWLVPQAALFGFRGHVDFEFTVERNGTMSSLKLLKSSGTASLDRAAQNALLSSRYLPLPDDYGPPRITMNVTFYYNEGPQGS